MLASGLRRQGACAASAQCQQPRHVLGGRARSAGSVSHEQRRRRALARPTLAGVVSGRRRSRPAGARARVGLDRGELPVRVAARRGCGRSQERAAAPGSPSSARQVLVRLLLPAACTRPARSRCAEREQVLGGAWPKGGGRCRPRSRQRPGWTSLDAKPKSEITPSTSTSSRGFVHLPRGFSRRWQAPAHRRGFGYPMSSRIGQPAGSVPMTRYESTAPSSDTLGSTPLS